MKVSRKKIDDGKLLLEVVATPQETNRALQAAQMAFAQQIGLKPEQGKSIDQLAEEQMGIKDLDSIVRDNAVGALVAPALNEKGIVAAWLPKPEYTVPMQRNKEFRFTMEVTPKPQYELKSYDPVKLEVPPFEIPEGAVDEQLKSMAESFMKYVADEDASKDPSRTVQSGDYIKIALKAVEDGKEVKGLSTDGRTYAVGRGYMPEGFDESIIGMKVGETKNFSFDAPKFDEAMRETTQKVDAELTVLEIQKEVLPELDDEFVKKNMPMYKSAAEMRADVAKGVERKARDEYDRYLRQEAAMQMGGRFEGHIPNEMYEAMRDALVANIRSALAEEGKSWEEFLEDNGGEQQFTMMLMLQVRETLVQGFALDAVFRHENMRLTDADIDAACEQMNPQMAPAQVRKQFEETGQMLSLREAAERFKANVWLVDTAEIVIKED